MGLESPWESPFLFQTHPVGVWMEWKHLVSGVSHSGYAIFDTPGGIRKGVKKTCQWHVFSPWESSFPFRCGNQIALPWMSKELIFSGNLIIILFLNKMISSFYSAVSRQTAWAAVRNVLTSFFSGSGRWPQSCGLIKRF